MSTNYYARTAETAPEDEGLHIGKFSGGWDFLFRAHPELGLTDCAAWHRYLSQSGVAVVAEHGLVETLDNLWPVAIQRPADVGGQHVMRCHADDWRGRQDQFSRQFAAKQWTDSHGHPFAGYEFC